MQGVVLSLVHTTHYGWRERERERETHTHTQTDRQTDRRRGRDRQIETESQKELISEFCPTSTENISLSVLRFN